MAELDFQEHASEFSQNDVLQRLANAIDAGGAPPSGEIKKAKKAYRDLEADQIDVFFAGKSWSEITLSSLQRDYRGDPSACLGFMNRAAFWYYVPAFIQICILDPYDADTIYETTLWHLTPSASDMSFTMFSDSTATLSRQQKEAISCAIAYMAREEDAATEHDNLAKHALNEFWGKYLPRSRSNRR